ncbi:sugar phosphate isomerase/epimerase [Bacillus sp. FJAT-50079]|uniref:sugar phosphate isomerase/epimerase family protein n=1 Tax=Bacillus sp. FJAT-50079 TaxID=2833577 RepID=UPI001BC9C694|nr:sugar phosphate isomerase/epimerase [Bacillus sp. FJAT-50079]MBS4208250.1 sugar phosphate isomerase/epimerase [Bacillus sp. FJAT-50079]
MKFSIITDMLGAESFEQSLQIAKDLGFEYIDLRAKLDGDTIDTISLEKAKELSELIEKHELKVTTLSSWAINPCTFSGPSSYDNYDENHHKKMSAELNRLFDLADAFAAPYIRVYPLHRKENFDFLTDTEKDKEYRNNAEVMRRHAEHAQKRGKILLIENEPPTLANNCEELGILVKYADHPNLKINWDIINGWRSGEYPTVEKYEHIKGYVYQTHLKGASRLVNSISSDFPNGRFNNFAIAGKDDFEHEDIMKAISTYDPNAIMTIDTHYPSFYQQDKIGEVEAVRLTKEFFEKILMVKA